MKISFNIFFLLILIFMITGCLQKEPQNDIIPLINDYEITSLDQSSTRIWKHNKKENIWADITPPKVVEVGFDERYISVLIIPTEVISTKSGFDFIESGKDPVYYIIDSHADELMGPYSEEEYLNTEAFNHIELKTVDFYKNNY